MAEIAAVPPNGLVVASTFSGCGGSSLGYRMAGYRVGYANEFVPAAREAYAANAAPGTVLDGRDVRRVRAADVLDAVGVGPGELDLLDGSPPCGSFSMAGRRAAGWGEVRKYSGTWQRTDDLFFEFARLVRGVQPRAFVAENVGGLVRGVARGYFLEILRALKACGYRVAARLLDAQWLGVPQSRQRVIFVGVREDVGLDPVHPRPLPYRYPIREAIPWIVDLKIHDPKSTIKNGNVERHPAVCPTVMADGLGGHSRSVYHVEADTDIGRYAIGAEWDAMGGPGTDSDRYFQLVRPSLDAPCPTITAAGGNLGIAGVTHPTERRKFTIAELKRLCGFPDDFVLTGSYAQQWERLGRSVPPVMMGHVARALAEGVLCVA